MPQDESSPRPRRRLRWILGLAAFVIVARFSWRLIHDAAERWAYQEAKGGGHWMDFSVLAEQHFHVGLTTVAGLFWCCCLLPPLLAWSTHRYGSHLAVVA